MRVFIKCFGGHEWTLDSTQSSEKLSSEYRNQIYFQGTVWEATSEALLDNTSYKLFI